VETASAVTLFGEPLLIRTTSLSVTALILRLSDCQRFSMQLVLLAIVFKWINGHSKRMKKKVSGQRECAPLERL